MSANIGVWEVKGHLGQVPGTSRGGARTKSATNNTQASGYVRACGAPEPRRSNLHGRRLRARSLRAAEPSQGRRVDLDMQYDASHCRHNF